LIAERDTGAPGIVMLAGAGESTRILYHALKDRVPIAKVVLEEPPSRWSLISNRVKKLGWATVAGQIAFRSMVVPFLQWYSRQRVAELKSQFEFDDGPIPSAITLSVASVNARETIDLLTELQPQVVVVNGTSIIGRRVLEQVPATFINVHAGITPAYRGVHGAYWALAAHDRDHCGVTVHLVDTGIDTGAVIAQARFTPAEDDTFVTYPYRQLHLAIPLLERALLDALHDRLETRSFAASRSRLWTHPTIREYIRNWVRHGVR
jgi:folate-dependent phosphoribosylglycinamide formyltransferase PurN